MTGTLIGGVLQILSRAYLKKYHPELLKGTPEYLKKHYPELLKDSPEYLKKRYPELFKSSPKLDPRGGEIIISGTLAQAILAFLAEHGLTAGAISTVTLLISQIPVSTVSKYLREAVPGNLSHLEKTKFTLVEGKEICSDICDQHMKYIFTVLQDETIPFEERLNRAYDVLTKYLNLKTPAGRLKFVLCLVFILTVLANSQHSGFYIIIRNLIEAIREGKISKAMGRVIVRKLIKKDIPIDPELIAIIDFDS